MFSKRDNRSSDVYCVRQWCTVRIKKEQAEKITQRKSRQILLKFEVFNRFTYCSAAWNLMLSTWRSNRSAIFCINLIKTDTPAVYVVIQIFTRNDTCLYKEGKQIRECRRGTKNRRICEKLKTDFQLSFVPTYGFQIYVMVLKYLFDVHTLNIPSLRHSAELLLYFVLGLRKRWMRSENTSKISKRASGNPSLHRCRLLIWKSRTNMTLWQYSSRPFDIFRTSKPAVLPRQFKD